MQGPRPEAHTDRGPGGFWPMAVALPLLMAASVAPSPLYVVYQRDWGFSSVVLTSIYAVYMGPLVAGLLVVGRISDVVGRRLVVVAALLAHAVSMGFFMTAAGVVSLVVARMVQGLACGAALGAVTSGLLDLAPLRRRYLGARLNGAGPAIGIGGGAAASGALVEFAPHPTVLVYAVLAGAFVALALAVAVRVERLPAVSRGRVSLRPRIELPVSVRGPFRVLLPAVIAGAAMGGFFNSLSGSVATQLLGLHSRAIAGLAITTLQLCAVGTSIVTAQRTPTATLLRYGSAALALGLAALAASLSFGSEPGYFLATGVAGAGYGAVYLSAVRTLAELASPGRRAGPLAALNVVNYVSLSVPTVLVGEAATHFGLRDTGMATCVVLAVLALGSLVGERRWTPQRLSPQSLA